MGWADDVIKENKAKKKKKRETWSDRVLNSKNDKEDEEIAPVKKEEKRTWLKAGAFSDGYQIGDLSKTILGTAGDITVGAAKGIGNLGEGLVDLGTYGVAGIGSMFGADTSGIKEFAKKELVNDALKPVSEFVDRGSVLGDKADSISQGLGYVGGIILTGGLGASAGLGAVGTTALTTSVTGYSAMGSGMGEAYRGGATDEEAFTYGLISGVAEAGTELIFGGLGKTFKVAGLSHGLSSADDMLAKKISSKISNQVAKNFVEFGIKAGAEGSEEVMAGIVQAIGKKVTYMEEDELLQILDDENLFEQFITGAVTSGIAQSGYVPGMTQGSLKEANQTGRDFITGFTQNEQTVLDKVAEKKIAEAEKDGTKLTTKEKNKIIEEVQEDSQKGLIDTTDIESIFGGEAYTRLQEAKTRAENIQKEIDVLDNMKNAEITVKEMKRLNSLEQRLKDIDIRTLQTNLDNEVFSKIGKDNFLQRSYYERAQRGKLFEAAEQSENESIRDWDKSFVDAKSNNSQRAHSFNEFGKKIIQDKNIKMRAVNYETLVQEGKMKKFTDENGNVSYKLKVNGEYQEVAVNGFKEKGVLNVNLQSNKAFETTVGHELGEFIKDNDADMYEQLKNIAIELGTADGTYTESSIQKYADIYGENTDDAVDEYVNDKLGELFTNDAFVEQLSTKPNIIKTIINEIKHLVKMATAGSKEQRKLVSLQHKLESKFKEAYKKSDLTKESVQTTQDAKYSLAGLKSKTANQTTLKQAEEMEANKKTPQEIYETTGWYRGSDGKWIYEIDDSNAEITLNDDVTSKRSYNLSDIYNFPELYKAYPELKDVEVLFTGTLEGQGSFDTKGNIIKIANNDFDAKKYFENFMKKLESKDAELLWTSEEIAKKKKDTLEKLSNYTVEKMNKKIKSTLSHEIQHWIQRKEGFPTGSSPSRMKKAAQELAYKKLEKYTQKLINDNVGNEQLQKHLSDSLEYARQRVNPITTAEGYQRVPIDGFSGHLSEMLTKSQYTRLQKLTEDYIKPNGFEMYKNTAGEQQARNVEERMKLTTEERKKTMPFVKNKDTIYAEDYNGQGAKYSLSDNQGRELSEGQQEYFKDSKVRDEEGNLLTLYHGTNADFTVFKKGKKGYLGPGIYLTDKRSYAERYTDYGTVKEVYANITNPLTVTSNNPDQQILKAIYGSDTVYNRRAAKQGLATFLVKSSDLKKLQEMGYDGIVWEHPSGNEYMVLNSNQLKNTDNLNPTSDPDIRYSLSEEIPLNQRLTGDALLDAEDLIYEIEDMAEVSPNGYVTLYHRTSKENADNIYKTGKMSAKEDGIFFSTKNTDSQAVGFGDGVVKIKIPVEKLVLDDIFSDEAHLKIPLKNKNEVVDVSEYLVTDSYSLSDTNNTAPRQRGQTYSEDVKIQEVISDVEQTINNLFNRINKIYDRITIDEEEYAPVNEASLPDLEQQYSESFNALDDDIAPVEQEPNQADEQSTLNSQGITLDEKTLRDEMLGLGVARKHNTKELKKLATELNTLITQGIDDIALDTFVDSLGTRLLVEHDPYQYDEAMQQAREYVRNTRLYVSEGTKKGIGQWNEFRRANMGKMKLTNDIKATPVDVAYMEMQDMFGKALFPDDIYNTADQLEHISQLLGDSKGQMSLYDYIEGEYGQEAWEDIKQSFMDNIKSKVSEASKLLESQRITDNYNAIPIDESLAPVEIAENVQNSTEIRRENVKPVKKPDTEEAKIARILTEEPKTENDRNSRKWAIFKANVFDKGIVFEDVSLKHKNRELMGKWDYTLTSEARGQNAIGQGHYEYDPYSKTSRQVSKSLNDIRAEVENSGHATEFYDYIYHKHNVDRMSLERKAQERIRATLRTSEYSHKELIDLARKRITEKTTEEDAKAIEFAKEYKALFDIKNKPVFGDSITAAQSQAIVNEYERQHPEFMDYAKDIYDYTNADRQELVKNGVISQETADLWQQMYPHYVPIRRAGHEGSAINVPLDTGRTGVNAPIKKATGGNKDILPLFDTMALRTLQTYRATAKNSFGVELMNTIGTKINSQKTSVDEVIDSIDTQEELLQEGKKGQKPTFTVFEDGEKATFEITKDMYDALKPLSDSSLLSKTFAVPNKISNFHRGVLTEYNPVFMLTNGIKDAQDILINSQHPARTYAKVGEAFAQLMKKGYWYQEYMNNGGEQNSYFDSQDHTFKTENKGLKKILNIPPLSTISKLNNFIEMTPRLAEYIASRETGRSVQVSMLDAARVTTNFKAGGNLTKFLNRNGATFLNASTQGLMQQVRNIREAKSNGARGWMNLATKFAIAGLPAVLLNSLLWDDDEEYEELSDYIKQNYYIVGKTDEGKFIRIPKGRTIAVIQEAVQQISDVATGNDEADLKSFIDLALTNLAPNNPIQDNILSPVVQVATNTTWYGDDLVPTRLQDLPEAEQFDESTDAFSKWLGGVTNTSPVKINYLLDQYTGGVGDVILPMMTPKAESGADTLGEKLLAPLNNKFTADAVLNNQNVADFYDKSEELTTGAKKSAATDEDVLMNKYINSVKGEMNELYKEKREVQNSGMSNSEKYEEVRRIQAQINELAKEGLGNYEDVEIKDNYSRVSDREYYKNNNGEWEKVKEKEAKALKDLKMSSIAKNRYFKAKNEISEIEDSDAEDKKTAKIKAIKNARLNDEQTAYLYDKYYASPEKLNVVLKTGIGMDAYLDLELQGFTADKDDEGKSISGSKKEKVFDYINTLDIGFEQRAILAKMYYPSYDDDNYDIIEYLNNDDSISYKEMVEILKTLKFEVDEEGNIWWD